MPENANQLIPEEIRDRFQQDEHGHVLFFTAPPVDTLPPVKPGSAIGHTASYLAAKHRDKLAAKEKRKASGLPEEEEEDSVLTTTTRSVVAKKLKQEQPSVDNGISLQQKIVETRDQALQLWIQQMQNGTDRIYQDLYGEHWETGKKIEAAKVARMQAEESSKQLELARTLREREERGRVNLLGSGVFKDDRDPRY